ncbi:uncharacterized protein [Oryza sativa Japonica Group]|jgi:hypothetical protein|uniref:Os07g0619500 protein n=2 Tax=Oryza sativa subsp. japonica TaxID=39947 RepID=Q8LHQ4_ORYSJ|nr:uncharacterized protein LOC4343926 [Oryza sativa Japonica Group]KAF2923955.1 hypothetical protein DAI22_07g232100 [Oryza sativa Japonica Group]BAC10120.1 unknown protein [Oryza sativa Japonica Group]BAF22208.1 Os07g0619500 [Oryza sativa Japonica Group]BAG92793.1 unnamed protein product [Oryza sativa Japonica Group]BAG98098.1 unnamed protein product [Oryza sativa Japonica Group]|eukprot:NP_001060294.1 Os07g0619500 [Oryza sativa Japonica Group]
MEVMVPVMAPSAPCSPRTAAEHHHLPSYCYFFSSAPTSPTRASYSGEAAAAAVGVGEGDGAFDFAFGFSGQLRESTPILAAADELFEGGRIRPLNTPHPSILQLVDDSAYASPRSPGRRRRIAAAEAAEVSSSSSSQRGRSGRAAPASSSSSASSRSRRATRSLSPFRGGGGGGADDEYPSSPPSPRTSMMRGCGSGSRKWRLKDLFLFRSASEGRATGAGSKDPLLKYTMLSSSASSAAAALHHNPQKLRGGGDGSASMRKGRGSTASASDMPYTVGRAAAEDMRRRTTTPLPFHRNSLFGYLRSNPAIHSISRKLSGSGSNRGKTAA